jgi:metacaspase-1
MSQRALLIGINYYGTSNTLSGCINDTHRVADILRNLYGFPSEGIVFMSDNLPKTSPLYPTKANIQRQMAVLKQATQPGDVAVFHYSGHGTTVRDPNSSNLDFQGVDDALIPVDVFGPNGSYVLGNEIVDDELWGWCDDFPDGSFLFSIVDACHSGSAFDLPYALKNGGRAGQYTLAKVERRPATPSKVVMLSGCKDDQTSLDTVDNKRQPAGALTYAFCDYLLHNPSKTINYFDFLTNIRNQIKANNPRVPNLQEPQLCFGRVEDANTQFTLLPPSKTRSVVFDDALLKSLITTLKNPPPTTPPPAPKAKTPPKAPVQAPAPAPAPAPAQVPLVRQPSAVRPGANPFQTALLSRRR